MEGNSWTDNPPEGTGRALDQGCYDASKKKKKCILTNLVINVRKKKEKKMKQVCCREVPPARHHFARQPSHDFRFQEPKSERTGPKNFFFFLAVVSMFVVIRRAKG